MVYDLEKISAFYSDLSLRIAEVKNALKRPLTLSEKILYTHLYDRSVIMGKERITGYTGFLPDRLAMQDATAQMALLQFMMTGRQKSALPASVHCDHLIISDLGADQDLKRAKDKNSEVYEFLSSVCRKYGFNYWKPGAGSFTRLQADLVDLALVLHAEHGGGNNSTFTMRVTSSTETDIYSAVTSAIGSLKGPLHGGANLRVLDMMENIKQNVKDWKDTGEVENYLLKILNREAFDFSGKIYGVGHAVYTISDPRAILLKEKARELAAESGKLDEYELYSLVEERTPEVFRKFKGEQTSKVVCINVDFYSGFVYSCIGIDCNRKGADKSILW